MTLNHLTLTVNPRVTQPPLESNTLQMDANYIFHAFLLQIIPNIIYGLYQPHLEALLREHHILVPERMQPQHLHHQLHLADHEKLQGKP